MNTFDGRAAAQKFYEAQLRAVVDQKSAAIRKQVEKAFEAAPETPDDVDPWFMKHFQKAPVSHDTAFYNQLHGAKAALREALTPGEAPEEQ